MIDFSISGGVFEAAPYEVALEKPPEVPAQRPFWLQVVRNCLHDSLFWQNFSTFALSFFIMFSGSEANFLVAFLLFDYFRQPAGIQILRSVVQGSAYPTPRPSPNLNPNYKAAKGC